MTATPPDYSDFLVGSDLLDASDLAGDFFAAGFSVTFQPRAFIASTRASGTMATPEATGELISTRFIRQAFRR